MARKRKDADADTTPPVDDDQSTISAEENQDGETIESPVDAEYDDNAPEFDADTQLDRLEAQAFPDAEGVSDADAIADVVPDADSDDIAADNDPTGQGEAEPVDVASEGVAPDDGAYEAIEGASATDADGNAIPVEIVEGADIPAPVMIGGTGTDVDDSAVAFDYSELTGETRTLVEDAANEIRRKAGRVFGDVMDIGKHLTRVQDAMRPGRFAAWLRSEFDWSDRTASNFISTYRRFDGIPHEAFTRMTLSAIYALSSGTVPDAVVQEMFDKARQVRVNREDVADALKRHRKKTGEQVKMPMEYQPTDGVPTFVDLMALPNGVEPSDDDEGDGEEKEAKPERSKEENAARLIAKIHWLTDCDASAVVAAMDDIQRESVGALLLWFADLAKALPHAAPYNPNATNGGDSDDEEDDSDDDSDDAAPATTYVSAVDAAYHGGDF